MINLIEFCYSTANISINTGLAYDALACALKELGNFQQLMIWEIHDPKCPYQRQVLPNPAILINGQLLQEAVVNANPRWESKTPANGVFFVRHELLEMLSIINLNNKYPKLNTVEQ
jgi:hypothetical protein